MLDEVDDKTMAPKGEEILDAVELEVELRFHTLSKPRAISM